VSADATLGCSWEAAYVSFRRTFLELDSRSGQRTSGRSVCKLSSEAQSAAVEVVQERAPVGLRGLDSPRLGASGALPQLRPRAVR
jgi:hypothetical protein